MMARRHWISALILLLAFALRVAWLDLKPAHFDEGVNGWFVDQMTNQGFYHYDPTNFHGPLHFYVLFLAQTLFGRSIWVLRMPIVLLSTACVGLVLAYRRYFDERVCQIAALAMAISPGMIFYGRYAIHETWLLFFLMLIVWGLAGLWHFGERRYLWAAALGVTGTILTKETYAIHLVAFLLAAVCLFLYEKVSPSAPWAFGGWKFGWRDVVVVAAVCAGLIFFFYTGGLLDWTSTPDPNDPSRSRLAICGLWETFGTWIHTGVDKKSGHEKEWYYWLQLLGRYEQPGLIGLAIASWMLWPRTPRVARYLAIYGLGALIAYTLVPYKTPWCIISLVWPFYFLFGLAVVAVAESIDRWTIGVAAGLLGLASFGFSWKLNYQDYADDSEPYVYVQTTTDVNKLLLPLQKLTRRSPLAYQIRGHMILPERYPFAWLLADYPQIDYLEADQLPDTLDADFLLVDSADIEKVEPLLRLEYFKLPVRIRGNSDNTATLYLFPQTFGEFVPTDTPKFEPGSPEAPPEKEQPAEKEPPAEKEAK